MTKALILFVGFVAVALLWFAIVSAIGVSLAMRYASPPTGSDTYFIVRSWVFRAALIVPPMLFAFWLGRVWSRTRCD
jgi:hypothetical protein